MWDEEREHLRAMERLLSKHNVPHSKFTPLFSAAGFALGQLDIYLYCSYISPDTTDDVLKESSYED